MKWLLSIVLIMILWGSPLAAEKTQPQEILKQSVDQVISLLQNPEYQDASKWNTQRDRIMAVINNIFDFVEVSKRTLGRNWKRFTPEERKTFAEHFADFLGYTYFKKVRDAYQGETVVYLFQEISPDGEKAYVKTRIPRQAGDIPIDYRMIGRKGTWRVYDVVIEGVSLVKNYRTQFNQILRKESPKQLIAKLQEKIAEQHKEVAASAE